MNFDMSQTPSQARNNNASDRHVKASHPAISCKRSLPARSRTKKALGGLSDSHVIVRSSSVLELLPRRATPYAMKSMRNDYTYTRRHTLPICSSTPPGTSNVIVWSCGRGCAVTRPISWPLIAKSTSVPSSAGLTGRSNGAFGSLKMAVVPEDLVLLIVSVW